MKKKLLSIITGISALLISFSVSFVPTTLKKTQALGKSSYWSTWINNNSSALTTGGTTLVSALKNKITQVSDGSANTVSYDGLWSAYAEADSVPGSNGSKIWDMYGGFQFTYQSSGKSYANEGDCYNREHSVPKSWFSENKPAYSDLVHLVPTDGKVNGMRSNYAFGEVQSATYTYSFPARSYNNVQYQTAGSSKLGSPKSINGVSPSTSIVFEPDDQYKGDFARIYMYFAVRYGGGTCQATGDDGGAMFTSTFTNNNPYVTNYGKALIKKWHEQDPVSEKETTRNDAIEKLQGNRNPFVDYPEWADKIFGTNTSTDTNGITISSSQESVEEGESFTISATATNNGTISWSSSNTSVATVSSNTSASGSSITVTGVSEGSATITASVTIDSQLYSKTCAVTVTSSGGSTIDPDAEYARLTSIASIDSTAKYVLGLEGTGFHYSGTSSWGLIALPSAQTPLYYTLTKGAGNTTFTASTTINNTTYYLTVPTSNTFSMTTSSASIKLGTTTSDSNSDVEYAVANATTTARHIRINGTSGLRSYAGTTGSMAYFYKVNESSSSVSLTSITLDTDNVTKTFTVGDTFSYSGLVVTAHYSDNSTKTVTPTSVSSPDMSSAGNKTITVTYTEGGVSRSATYNITVNSQTATSITATVSKNFRVGETITKDDITLKDNLNNVITDYTFNNYQFTYSDASSGGALTDKTFPISYDSLNTTLTVKVQRSAYVAPSTVSDIITASDLPATNTTYATFTSVSKNSDAIYAGQSAKDSSGNIQLRSKNSNSGIVSTTSGGTIKSVTITVGSGTNTVEVYGSNSAYSDATDLFTTNTQGTLVGSLTAAGTVTFTSNYTYVGIRSHNGAIYLSSVEITYGSSESALNVANYIMYQDNNNQCQTRFGVAKGYFENLSQAERSTFMTSSDYVIATARARFEAWAANQGKRIQYINGDYSIVNASANHLMSIGSDHSLLLIVIIIISGILLTGTYLFLLKRKSIRK